jgi:Protein of unknown function (DUF2970)
MPDPAPRDTGRPDRPASLREVVAAVFWSFFGVRKRASLERDALRIRPHQVIIAGVGLAALFVVLLIVAVRLIVRAAG